MKDNKKDVIQVTISIIAVFLTIVSAILLFGGFNVSSKSIVALILIVSVLVNLGDILMRYKKKK